jgi:hypothetical protein
MSGHSAVVDPVPRAPLPDGIEMIRLRKITATFGFAEVRLRGVMLHNLKVEKTFQGLRISPPTTPDKDGKPWPSYVLQPGTREIVEAAVRQAWERSS